MNAATLSAGPPPAPETKSKSKLTVTLPSDREFRLARVFDAPRRLVWEAITTPEHLARWYGPHRLTVASCDMDFRPGGSWRIVLRGPDGQDHPAFFGVYREIVPPERVVQTFHYDVDVIRDFGAVETLTLNEHEGRTTLTVDVLHMSKEARDGHMNSGMEAGAGESYDRLEEFLRTLS